MAKAATRLASFFSAPRTARNLTEAFAILISAKPKDLGQGCVELAKDGFRMRLFCTPTNVKILGASPNHAEFLWFNGSPSDLPTGIRKRATAWAVKSKSLKKSSTDTVTQEPPKTGSSRFPETPWFKVAQTKEAQKRFHQNAGVQRQLTRSAPTDAIRLGGSPGHPTDNE